MPSAASTTTLLSLLSLLSVGSLVGWLVTRCRCLSVERSSGSSETKASFRSRGKALHSSHFPISQFPNSPLPPFSRWSCRRRHASFINSTTATRLSVIHTVQYSTVQHSISYQQLSASLPPPSLLPPSYQPIYFPSYIHGITRQSGNYGIIPYLHKLPTSSLAPLQAALSSTLVPLPSSAVPPVSP